MRPCRVLPSSSARHGPRASIPHYARRLHSRSRGGNPAHPNTVDFDEGESLTIDSENKTVDTAVGKLPLSPVMDPAFWEATQRHSKPKPKPGKAQNSLERQIRANPFAQALATPNRQCGFTQAHVPKFFLADFKLVQHPEDERPWWVPQSVAASKARPDNLAENDADTKSIAESFAEAEQALEEKIESNEATTDAKETEAGQGTSPGPSEAWQARDDGFATYGPAGYILARRDMIAALDAPIEPRKKAIYSKKPSFLFGGTTSALKHVAHEAVWRNDMDTYLLRRMREDAMRDILYLSKLCTEDQRYYIMKCWGWDDVQYKHKGAVLWFGEPAENSDQAREPPGSFATFELEGKDTKGEDMVTSLAVHNMPLLLGADMAESVKAEAPPLHDGSIFMLAGRRTAALQAKLWKLQGYLADYSTVSQ